MANETITSERIEAIHSKLVAVAQECVRAINQQPSFGNNILDTQAARRSN